MNRIRRIILITGLFALTAIAISSCSSSKNLTRNSLREISANRLIREISANSFDFDDLQAKVGIKVETEGNSINLKGQLKMKKDSILWASVSLPLGLELARAKLTNDSIFFINKSDKSYLAENINSFNYLQGLPTDIKTIQSVFIGNLFLKNKGSENTVVINDNKYNLLSEEILTIINNNSKKNFTINNKIIIDPTLFRITKYEIVNNDNTNYALTIEYSDFIEIGSKFIPSIIEIKIMNDSPIKIVITYSNITTNQNTLYNFSIPKKYERIKK
ncbi:MAG: DUF4292 domain-containing protein [Candidatus Limimorpha sp.]